MSAKLSKVTKDLNVGLATLVEYLHKQGFSEVAENNPNARISEEQYEMLLGAFSKDKNVKKESEMAAQKHKERPKNESVVLDSYAQKVAAAEVPAAPKDSPIKFKTVGKIDLDSLSAKKKAPVEPQKEPEDVSAPVPVPAPQEVEEPVVPPVEQEQPVVVEEPLETSEASTKATQSEEVFTYGNKNIQSSINVVGKIDLSQLNQQTRPKKKTKEEKRKEREEKYAPKNNAAANNNNAGGNADDKKKRNKIQRERVDINKPFEAKKGGKPGKNDKNRRSVEHTQPDEEAVQRQVRETLVMLTNKQKSKWSL
jgi:translation initiation factor IF-2